MGNTTSTAITLSSEEKLRKTLLKYLFSMKIKDHLTEDRLYNCIAKASPNHLQNVQSFLEGTSFLDGILAGDDTGDVSTTTTSSSPSSSNVLLEEAPPAPPAPFDELLSKVDELLSKATIDTEVEFYKSVRGILLIFSSEKYLDICFAKCMEGLRSELPCPLSDDENDEVNVSIKEVEKRFEEFSAMCRSTRDKILEESQEFSTGEDFLFVHTDGSAVWYGQNKLEK